MAAMRYGMATMQASLRGMLIASFLPWAGCGGGGATPAMPTASGNAGTVTVQVPSATGGTTDGSLITIGGEGGNQLQVVKD
ncbi:MAG TPA: hypothetical protein VMW56_21150, partial [Candidatus Margulisiibacteriota bacterium]|nr:hypothetical protein [Candidatus Margulisiibacteriota bacterium]